MPTEFKTPYPAADSALAEAPARPPGEQLTQAIEHLSEPICLCDRDDRIVVANAAWRALNKEVIEHASPGMKFERHLRAGLAIGNYPGALGRESQWLSERMARLRAGSGAHEQSRQGGVWLLLRDEKLPGGGTLTFSLDITERKRVELSLAASEERFRQLTMLSSDWYWEQDEQFRFTFMSGELQAKTGIAVSKHLGRTRWEMPAINFSAADWARHRAQLERHEPFRNLVMRLPDRDGREHWVSIAGDPIFDPEGGFRGYRGTGRDVTSQVLLERSLREEKERFKSFAQLTSDYFWETDADHRIKEISYGGLHHATLPLGSQIGKRRWELPSELPGAEGWRRHREGVEAHRPVRDFRFSRHDAQGELRHISISGDPLSDAGGGFAGYRGIGHDITERIRAEEEMRETKGFLQGILDASPNLIFVTDARGKLSFVNQNAAQMFDVSTELLESGAPERLRLFTAGIETVLRSRKRVYSEVPVTGPDGERHLFYTVKVPLPRPNGNVEVLGIAVDITDRKRAEDALHESEQLFRTITDTAPAMFWMSDAGGSREFFSAGWILFTDCSQEQLRGDGWAEGVHAEDRRRVLDAERAATDHRKPFSAEYRLRQRDGEYAWVVDRAVPRHDLKGDFAGMVGGAVSIHDRVLGEQELQRHAETVSKAHAALQAEMAQRLRLEGEVMAISERQMQHIGGELHDGIGQEMTGIALACKILERKLRERHDANAADAARIVEAVNRAIDQTRSLAHGLGAVEAAPEGLMSALALLAERVSSPDEIRCEFRCTGPVLVEDPALANHLFRVAQEATGNVLKHARASAIAISLSAADGVLRLSVEDDGIGLTAHSAAKGSGMGLRLMRYRTDIVGGTLEIARRAGGGTVVNLSVPLARENIEQ